jgi:hypothetical protein
VGRGGVWGIRGMAGGSGGPRRSLGHSGAGRRRGSVPTAGGKTAVWPMVTTWAVLVAGEEDFRRKMVKNLVNS